MNDIHKIGTEAVKALKALTAAKASKKSKTAKANELIEVRNETARPLLQQVHDAIAAGQSVNGQTTWDGWAKQAGWSKRALNYIINGRPQQKKKEEGNGNTSSRLRLDIIDFVYNRRKDARYMALVADFYTTKNNDGRTDRVKLDVTVQGTKSRETLDACAKKMIAMMKQLRLWDKENAAKFQPYLEEAAADAKWAAEPKKPVAMFNKGEIKAYDTLKRVLDALARNFENGTISAEQWRSSVTELENKNFERAIFRKQANRFADFMAQVRTRMEAAITEEANRQTVPDVLSDNNCPPNLAPEIVEVAERRKRPMAEGFENGLVPEDGIGTAPTVDKEQP